ncbi:TonB-dependent siderophore receptor [Celerinatantimonas yamalensis]|uniref:TonB-dependent siderophore receptor n=2 Tax=Celerinatantimonas yamalensis TaxID=559956 RepID=A0ABW9G260_9GAMM
MPLRLMRYSTLTTALLLSLSAHAKNQTKPPQKLDKYVVTASVIDRSRVSDVKDYAGSRTVLNRTQIQDTASQSIDTALQSVPGIKIQDETGTGVLPNISVRGLKASRSGYAQFLMDGVPLTLAPYGHTGQSVFPATLSNIDRIDIVRGGAAVQYGPNNVGGVINLITKPIPNDWQSEINTRLTVFKGGDTPLKNIYLRTGGWLTDTFGIQLEGNVVKGDSFRKHSDTAVNNYQIKTDWLISDTQELQTFLQHYRADTEMPGALSPSAYQQDRHQSQRPYDHYRGRSTRWHAKYTHDLQLANGAKFELLTFGHRSDRNFKWGYNQTSQFWSDPRVAATDIRTSPREFTVYGVEPKIAIHMGSKQSVSQKLIIGTRYVHEEIGYQLTQTPLNGGETTIPRNWHLRTRAYATYLSNQIGLMNDRLKITPGLRFESVHMHFDDIGKSQSQNNTINELLPGLTVSYNLTDDWVTYTDAQKSLRAPQISSIRGKGNKGGELSWNYEVGTRYTHERNSFNVSLYRINFKDQLQWESASQTFKNIGSTRHQGVEMSGRYSPERLQKLSVGLSYNYLDATLREGVNKGHQLADSSRHQLSWDASYNIVGYDTTVSGYYFSHAYSDDANTKQEDAAGSKGRVPSYTVWNLNIGKELYHDKTSALKLNVSVNNLFDRDYYFRGIDTSPVGRYPAPGRSYTFDLNYTF